VIAVRGGAVHLLYSLSKSFPSTAAAFAIAEGLLDLDATMLSYFPEFDSEITDPHSRSMLIRDVAAMASGHLEETVERAFALDPVEPVRGFLLIPADREPGSVFAYNQPCTYAPRCDHPAVDRPDPDRIPAPSVARPAGHR
jgi:CubicO group peptidase (beta-lactamase class C family)